jgi:serine acetyltransferase
MFNLIRTIREDVRCTLERDPAARNWFEVVTSYAGLHSIWLYRIAHTLWRWRLRLLARWLSQFGTSSPVSDSPRRNDRRVSSSIMGWAW